MNAMQEMVRDVVVVLHTPERKIQTMHNYLKVSRVKNC
jgi:hypothetical protein